LQYFLIEMSYCRIRVGSRERDTSANVHVRAPRIYVHVHGTICRFMAYGSFTTSLLTLGFCWSLSMFQFFFLTLSRSALLHLSSLSSLFLFHRSKLAIISSRSSRSFASSKASILASYPSPFDKKLNLTFRALAPASKNAFASRRSDLS